MPTRVPEKDPVVLLLEFGDSSAIFEVSIWARDPWAARVTRSELNMTIWQRLKEAGITIAFPQLDVHFDPPRAEAPMESGSERKKSQRGPSFD